MRAGEFMADLWAKLKEHTCARIGLQRSGHSLSTRELLGFQLGHAMARDAVHETWDVARFVKKFKAFGEKPLVVNTKINIREQHLRYPSLGRVLSKVGCEKLMKYHAKHKVDVVFIVTDGLSPKAIDTHMLPFWKTLKPLLSEHLRGLKIAFVVVPYGRVALSDDVGKFLGAKMSVIFVGERPGLSSVDSLGIYLTYAPKRGNTDANRNCISNVHPPEGLAYTVAADKLLYLMKECLRLKLSGVKVKEEATYLAAHLSSRLGLGI